MSVFPQGRVLFLLLLISVFLVFSPTLFYSFAQGDIGDFGRKGFHHGKKLALFRRGEPPLLDGLKFYNRRSSLVVAPSNYTDDDVVEALKALDEEYSTDSAEREEVFTAATAELTELYANLTESLNGTLLGVYTAIKGNQTANSLPTASSKLCPRSTINISVVDFVGNDSESNSSGTEEEIEVVTINEKHCIVVPPYPHPRAPEHHGHRKHFGGNEHESRHSLPFLWPPAINLSETLDGNVIRPSIPETDFEVIPVPEGFPSESPGSLNQSDVPALKVPGLSNNESETGNASISVLPFPRPRVEKHNRHHHHGFKLLRKALYKEAWVALQLAEDGNTTVQIPVVRVVHLPEINTTTAPPSEASTTTNGPLPESWSFPYRPDVNGTDIEEVSSPIVAELWSNVSPRLVNCTPGSETTEDCQFSFDTNSSAYQSLDPSGDFVVRLRSKAELAAPPSPSGWWNGWLHSLERRLHRLEKELLLF